jgi:hypothetical protein
VLKWKAAHAIVPEIIVSFDATWFQAGGPSAKLPDGRWGHFGRIQVIGATGERIYVPGRFGRAAYLGPVYS